MVGSYNADQASLTKPHPYWAVRVGGNINLAINDSANFHMSLAELHATGRSGDVQEIEVMGTDLGNTEDGLVQGVAGNFPLGTLRIDANSTARLVDTHDNDTLGQDAGEAFYCDTLVVDGYLDTNGYKVYANEVIINGGISDEGDVIIIDPPVPGDLNGDSASTCSTCCWSSPTGAHAPTRAAAMQTSPATVWSTCSTCWPSCRTGPDLH